MKILHDHIPKIKISWESLTANAHEEALPSNGLGSWYVGSILNGVGTAGLGWKYGYEIPMNEIPGEYSQIYDHWKTYAFCLDQPHIVVLCSCKVILVNDMMFRCPFRVDTSLSILGGKIRKINAQADHPYRTLRLRQNTTTRIYSNHCLALEIQIMVSEPNPGTLWSEGRNDIKKTFWEHERENPLQNTPLQTEWYEDS